MERATIYRSLSAPTALVGGLLSLGGFAVDFVTEYVRGQMLSAGAFLGVWLGILVLTLLANCYFLWREAKLRGTPFFSAGMKCALRSVVPPFLLAGFLTIITASEPTVCAIVWIIAYGIGLLAMQHFAPRPIVVLGWMFLIAGCLTIVLLVQMGRMSDDPSPPDGLIPGSFLMGLTFGGFHIIYAISVWALGEERSEASANASSGAGNV